MLTSLNYLNNRKTEFKFFSYILGQFGYHETENIAFCNPDWFKGLKENLKSKISGF